MSVPAPSVPAATALRGAARLDAIARVLWAILILNFAVAAAKLAYGVLSGALAIRADGIHSLLDGSSNVLGLVGIAVARRPPDENHPYGHRKYETFAALGIVAMLLFGVHAIASAAWHRLQQPSTPEIGPAGFAVMGATLVINVFVVWFERREGRRLQSELLLSDAAHTGSDVLASLMVVASFVAVRAGFAWADIAAAGIIIVLILRAGFEILQSTLSTLSDERRIDPQAVERAALEVEGVREAHNVRSRGPADEIRVDLHILVDPTMRIDDAHAIGHRVEQHLRQRFAGLADIVVHVEPALESERAKVGVGGALQARD